MLMASNISWETALHNTSWPHSQFIINQNYAITEVSVFQDKTLLRISQLTFIQDLCNSYIYIATNTGSPRFIRFDIVNIKIFEYNGLL